MAQLVTDYERLVVGYFLVHPQRISDALTAGVDPAWFTDDSMSLLWSAMVSIWKRGEIVADSPLIFRDEAVRISKSKGEKRCGDGLTVDMVCKAIDDAPIGGCDSAIRLLRNCYLERQTKNVVAVSLRDFETWADATDGVLELRNKLDGVLNGQIAQKKIAPRAVFDKILAEYAEAHHMRVAADGPRNLKWTPGLKLPWPKMTEFMNGLRPGLHVIAARPSVGKTSFAVNLMRFWAEQNYATIFCSLDMPRVEVMRRFLSEKARVSARKAAFSPTAADLEAMRRAEGEMAAWPLSVVETRDVDDLRTLCMVERAAGRLDVVVVDYLQLLHARALGREDAVEYARVSYVSDTLKRLANELQIPVVALAQLNRESTKQDQQGRLPGLADLRGSGAIEQDAFTVTILHRDQGVVEKWRTLAANPSTPEYELAARLIPGTAANPQYRYNFDDLDPVWWILCKAQNGPTGKLPFVVRKKYFTWMLADYEATATSSTSGYGAAQKTTVDNSPYFLKVHSDWRHDAIEEVLRLQLALIPDDDDVANIDAES